MSSPTVVRDPAGLLNRIPELQPLCADLGVRRAVASGEAFKVYRALAWARLAGRLGAHRRTIDQLLRNRRAFARPLGAKPWLGTINGFGASLVGHIESEPNGTFVTTHALVALFRIPLLPLGAYVVSREGRAWRIFARVPLSGIAWLWSRAVALGVAAAVLVGAYGAFHAMRHHDLVVVNGFAQPIQVTVGPAAFTVPGGDQRTVNLPVGTHAARAVTGEGEVLDEGPVPVAFGSAVLVWNVAGAAPVMEREIVYTTGPAPANAAEPASVFHCAERLLALHGVDFAFQEPPRQLSMPKGQSRVVKRAVMVGEQGGKDGALLCGYLLFDRKDGSRSAAVLERRARAARWAPEAVGQALWAALQVSRDEELRVARSARDARPEDVRLSRMYQDVALAAGGAAALRAEYRTRAEAAPASAAAQYLYARLLPVADGLPLAEQLLQRFPADSDLLRLVTGFRYDRGDWAGVDRAWRDLRTRATPRAGDLVEVEATALVAQGRQGEALHIVEEIFPQLEPDARERAALVYAHLAQRAGASTPDRFIVALEKEKGPLPLLRVQSGLNPGPFEPSPIVDALLSAGKDPKDALSRAAALGPAEASVLGGEALLVLYGEALRSGDPAYQVLETALSGDPAEMEPFRRFVRGEPGAAADLNPALRAAAELARSRNSSISAAERASLRAAALHDDLLGTLVSRAVKAWPESGH